MNLTPFLCLQYVLLNLASRQEDIYKVVVRYLFSDQVKKVCSMLQPVTKGLPIGLIYKNITAALIKFCQ